MTTGSQAKIVGMFVICFAATVPAGPYAPGTGCAREATAGLAAGPERRDPAGVELPVVIDRFFRAYNRRDGSALREIVRRHGGVDDPEPLRRLESSFVNRWIRAFR